MTSSQATGNRVYNSANFSALTTSVTLESGCQNIPWAYVGRIDMAYNDVFGNHIVVGWKR